MVKLGLGATLGLSGLAIIGILAFVFRDKISDFFSNITGGLEGAKEIGETTKILNENFQGFLTGVQDLASGKTFEGFEFPKLELPSFDFSFLFPKTPLTEAEQFDFSGLEGGVSPEPTGLTPDPFRDAERFAKDFPEPFIPIVPPPDPIMQPVSQLNIGQEQPFTEAPLGALSLSAIIDKFMVTASQAANIKFIAQQGGDPFADPSNIFGENPPAVTPGFQGLTPEQIFAQLVGGNIQNF